jgi:lysophospholipase L1-like esterase
MKSLLFQSGADPATVTPLQWIYPNSYTSWLGLRGMAGNSFQGGVTLVDGRYYLYQNDEWFHGGIHRWRVDGLTAFQLSEFPVSWSGSYSAPNNPNDLLLGLPFDQVNLPNNTAGWTRSPTADVGDSIFTSPYLRVYTNAIGSNPLGTPDLAYLVNAPGTTTTLSKDLPRAGWGNWTIDMEVVWRDSGGGGIEGLQLDILDVTGKRIVRIRHPSLNPINVNGAPVVASGGGDAWMSYSEARRPLVIEANVATSLLMVTYGDYSLSGVVVHEAGASVASPDVIRLSCAGLNAGTISITRLNWWEQSGTSPPVITSPGEVGTLHSWFTAYNNTYTAVNADGTGGAVASGGTCRRWLDRSGLNNHVSNTTSAATSPVWRTGDGLCFRWPTATLNSSDLRNISTTTIPRQNSSGGMVVSFPGAYQAALVDFNTGVNGYATCLGVNCRPAVHTGTVLDALTGVTLSSVYGRRSVITWQSNSSGFTIRVNGAVTNAHAALSVLSMAGIFFGTFSGGGGKPIRIYESVVYSEDIGGSNITILENYLRTNAGSSGDPTRTVVTWGDSMSMGVGSAECRPWHDRVSSRPNSMWYTFNCDGGAFFLPVITASDINTYLGGSNEKVVVIWMGTNDIITHGRTGVQLEADFATACTTLNGAGWKVIVCTLQHFATNNTQRAAFNTLLKANYAGYADAIVKLDEAPELDNAADAAYYTSDGVHLTDAGHAAAAALIQTAMASV